MTPFLSYWRRISAASPLAAAVGGTGMDRAEPQVNDTGTAGVIARPPLLFLAALLLGFALDHLLPLPVVVPRGGELAHRMIPGALILIGLALAAAGIRNFSRAR